MNVEGRTNRRALGDIRNQIPSHPVTRSFCAQLLVKAQAQAPVKNIKKLVVKPKPEAVLNPVQTKQQSFVTINNNAQVENKKELVVKPKPKVVINPVETKQQSFVATNNNAEVSPKKKASSKTLTSALNAGSKLAYEIPKEQLLGIDAGDLYNELAVVEYVEIKYNFYKLAENESRVHDYMHARAELNERMRSILIDWLVEVHNKVDLTQETLYLTINILDR